MKISSNYNQSFGMKITNNDTYKGLLKYWNMNYKPKDVEKALNRIKGCAPDTFELTFTDSLDDMISSKTFNTHVEFSYTKEPYYNHSLKSQTAVKMAKANPTSDNPEGYKILNPKETAKDIVEEFSYYKKSIKDYIGE